MKKETKIVIIEDSPEYRSIISVAIQKESDMELLGQFGTAEEAQSYLQDLPTQNAPDIILLDLNLPGISGIEALPWFVENRPEAKIIVLSQSDQEPDVLHAISAGAKGYLLKGSTRHQIFQAIRNVMTGGATIDPKVAIYILKNLRNSPRPTAPKIKISSREREILDLLADGLVQKEISELLNISDSTVSTHIGRIYKKLKVQNAPAAVSSAYKHGLFQKSK